MTADPGMTPTRSQLPVDPTLGPGDERYRYVVLVRSTARDGRVGEAVVEMRSDDPLSLAEMREQAAQYIDLDDYPNRQGKKGILRADISAGNVTVDVLSSGRRG